MVLVSHSRARLTLTKQERKPVCKEVLYGDGNRTSARKRVPQLPSQRPREVIIEDLSHLRGKARSKKISRLCSSWARDENKERITVHAYVGGSGIQTVNAAYTSQTCLDPTCGYVHRDNRHGDVFHCCNPYWDCNWQGDVDYVAAMSIKSRIKDREISRFTPYKEVNKILDERFLRRMQSRGIPTDDAATAHGPTPSEPQSLDTTVGGTHYAARMSPVPVVGTGETRRLGSEKNWGAKRKGVLNNVEVFGSGSLFAPSAPQCTCCDYLGRDTTWRTITPRT